VTIFTSTLSSILSLLGSTLQLTALFPALVFVLANYLVILPYLAENPFVKQLGKLEGGWQTAMVLAAIGVIGYTLTALNIPLIRFFEGYPYQDSLIGRSLRWGQQQQWRAIQTRLGQLKRQQGEVKTAINQIGRQKSLGQMTSEEHAVQYAGLDGQLKRLETDQLDAQVQLTLNFPPEGQILPTGMGNVIAAFENYPKDRYGIDAVALWPRLMPILDKQGYAAFVERQKLPFDFLLNLTALTGIFAVEYMYVRLYYAGQMPWLELLVLGLAVYILYRVATTSAFYWGSTVMVAFDLHRMHLWQALLLKLPATFADEKSRWTSISEFMIHPGKDLRPEINYQTLADKKKDG
jgi:hypothetical protein